MAKMEALIENMTKEATKITDPAYIKQLQAKADEFACGTINLTVQNGAVTGTMSCSQKVGSNLKITGSMKAPAK
jgi:hypothetical protein